MDRSRFSPVFGSRVDGRLRHFYRRTNPSCSGSRRRHDPQSGSRFDDPFPREPAFIYFVFVHKIGEPNAADGLVLRYDALGYNDTPKIRWATASRLIVTLHRADMGRVTKQRTLLDGIEIVYDIEN